MPQGYINMNGIGTLGINTDSPPWAVDARAAQAMRDVIISNGLATQRRGWENYLDASPFSAIAGAGAYYINSLDALVTVISQNGSDSVYSKSKLTSNAWAQVRASKAGLDPLPRYVPRAQYQDEILLCDQNGVWPMLRFMGRATTTTTGLDITIPANSSTYQLLGISTIDPSTPNGPGTFLHPLLTTDSASFRITKRSGDNLSLRNINFTSAVQSFTGESAGVVFMWGTTWPCVSVYNDGLIVPNTTIATSPYPMTMDGGVTSGDWGNIYVGSGTTIPMSDSIRVATKNKWVQRGIKEVTSTTGITTRSNLGVTPGASSETLKMPFDIMRRCPFRDVEVHKECLWGTGVKQYPSRVYYSSRQWDMQTPNRLTQPWNGITDFFAPNDGILDYVDVEGSGDGDMVMALLSSDGPLLILTQRSCYGAYGSWPSFEKQMVAAGAGCIDTRSAVGVAAYGQFWAGESGIYGYRRGKVTDLTGGRINDYWRGLMRRYDSDNNSYVVSGVARNHLIVSAHVTRGTTTDVTLGCNLATGAWTELSNMKATAMHAPTVWGDEEQLIAALEGRTTLVDLAPAINMTGGAKDADGTEPQLLITSGSANPSQGDPDGESRITELRVSGIVKDSALAPPDDSSLTIEVRSDGAVTQGTTTSQTTGVLQATTGSDIRRERLRIGNSGRTHSVTITTANTSPNNATIAIAEVGMNVRKRRATR